MTHHIAQTAEKIIGGAGKVPSDPMTFADWEPFIMFVAGVLISWGLFSSYCRRSVARYVTDGDSERDWSSEFDHVTAYIDGETFAVIDGGNVPDHETVTDLDVDPPHGHELN